MQAQKQIIFTLLILVFAWPYQSYAASVYEDQTKYLLENDSSMNQQEAEAHRKSFAPGKKRTGAGQAVTESPKVRRKLGSSPVDRCLKKKINQALRSAIDSEVETLFGGKAAWKRALEIKPEADLTLEEEIDPQWVRECEQNVAREKKKAPAAAKSKECANYPPNTVEFPKGSGICDCKLPYVWNTRGTACVLPEARGAEELVSNLENTSNDIERQIAKDLDPDLDFQQLYEAPPASRGFTERFFNRQVRILPRGAIDRLAKRYTSARSLYRKQLEEARGKLKAARADLANGQERSAAILAKEAKEIVEGIPLHTLRAQFCAVYAKPTVTKQGAYTVIPGLVLPEGCECGGLDFTVMKRALKVYGPVPVESYKALSSIPACQAVAGELVNVPESLEDILINDHYGKRGLMLLYWTSSWLYADVKAKE